MNKELIETFLSIERSGSLTNSARDLFVSQSTISNRLKNLEAILGVRLFIRKKGFKNIELTNFGHEFAPLAEKFLDLLNEMDELKHNEKISRLRIAVADVSNDFMLKPLFKQFIEQNEDIKLKIETASSDEILGKLTTRDSDIGITNHHVQDVQVLVKPLYEETMCLVFNKSLGFEERVSVKELEQEKAIYVDWGTDYLVWHKKYFDPKYAVVRLNSATMIDEYLSIEDAWAIVPVSVAFSLVKENKDLRMTFLKENPPARTTYIIENKQRSNDIKLSRPKFFEALRLYLDAKSEEYGGVLTVFDKTFKRL